MSENRADPKCPLVWLGLGRKSGAKTDLRNRCPWWSAAQAHTPQLKRGISFIKDTWWETMHQHHPWPLSATHGEAPLQATTHKLHTPTRDISRSRPGGRKAEAKLLPASRRTWSLDESPSTWPRNGYLPKGQAQSQSKMPPPSLPPSKLLDQAERQPGFFSPLSSHLSPDYLA